MQTAMLYDGQCVLCRNTLRVVQRLDWYHKIEAVDIQDHQAMQTRYPNLAYDDLMGSIHVVRPNGDILIGFFAMRYLARLLPLVWLIYPLLFLPGMNWFGPQAYGWVARRRYAINRAVGQPICEDGYCKIP